MRSWRRSWRWRRREARLKEEEERRALLEKAAEVPEVPWEDENKDENEVDENQPKESFFLKFVSGYAKATTEQQDRVKDTREKEKILGNAGEETRGAKRRNGRNATILTCASE